MVMMMTPLPVGLESQLTGGTVKLPKELSGTVFHAKALFLILDTARCAATPHVQLNSSFTLLSPAVSFWKFFREIINHT